MNVSFLLLFNVTLMHFRFKIVLIPKAFKNIICLDSLGLSVGKPWPDLILYCGINKTISPGIKSSLTRIKISTSPKESQAFKTVYVCMYVLAFLFPVTAQMELDGDIWGDPGTCANAGNC